MCNDTELVAAVAAGEIKAAPDKGPRLADWSPVAAIGADICDSLQMLQLAVLAAAGSKTLPKFKPSPRPTTGVSDAMSSAKAREQRAKYDDLMAMLKPDDTEGG